MTPETIINPFVTNQPTLGSDFFGREDVLGNVKSFLHNAQYEHFFILGTRRIGKTSLLKNIAERYTLPDYLTIYVNMQEYIESGLQKILRNLEKKILRKTPIRKDTEINPLQDFEMLIGLAQEYDSGQLLLLIDEFDVLHYDNSAENQDLIEYLHQLPTRFSLSEKKPKLIYAVGRNYKETGQFLKEKFGEQAIFNDIGEFNFETVKQIVQLSEKAIPFDEKAVQRIYDYTGGNPYFTQCLAYKAFEAAENTGKNLIVPKIVDRQFIPAVKSYGSGALAIWNELLPSDRLFLFIAAHSVQNQIISRSYFYKTASELRFEPYEDFFDSAFERLVKNNFLIPLKQNNFGFKIEFFRQWIVMDVKKKEIKNYIKLFSKQENL